MHFFANIRYIFKIAILLSLLLYCKEKDPDDYIPKVYVNLILDIYDPEFYNLTLIGGYVNITGGAGGIFVYRFNENEFVAIDRLSSYQPKNGCIVNIDSSGLYLIDPCSASKFSVIDGNIVEGPAKYALRLYNSDYDGGRYLRIYNQ